MRTGRDGLRGRAARGLARGGAGCSPPRFIAASFYPWFWDTISRSPGSSGTSAPLILRGGDQPQSFSATDDTGIHQAQMGWTENRRRSYCPLSLLPVRAVPKISNQMTCLSDSIHKRWKPKISPTPELVISRPIAPARLTGHPLPPACLATGGTGVRMDERVSQPVRLTWLGNSRPAGCNPTPGLPSHAVQPELDAVNSHRFRAGYTLP